MRIVLLISTLMLLLGVNNCHAQLKSQDKIHDEIVERKNVVSISTGLKSVIYSINYERFFRFKNDRFFFTGSIGVGYLDHINVPAYIHFGYGRKWTAEIFAGSAIVFNTTYSSKELRDGYRDDPKYGNGVEVTYPVNPILVTGIGSRYHFSSRFYVKGEMAVSFTKVPTYKSFPKWRYTLDVLFPEVSAGIRF